MYLITLIEGPSHKFSYISLVLQLILCHGQYIIISDLSDDHESSLSRVAAILNTKPLQVMKVWINRTYYESCIPLFLRQ